MKTGVVRLALLLSVGSLSGFGSVLLDTGVEDVSGGFGTSGFGQAIRVMTATHVTGFAFRMYTSSGGNAKFMIWDDTNSNMLFSTILAQPVTYATEWVSTGPIDFTLNAGSDYFFGVISDTFLNIGYFGTPLRLAENGLSMLPMNSNYSQFGTTAFTGLGSANLALQIYGDDVPEPSAVVLMMSGLIGLAAFDKTRRDGLYLVWTRKRRATQQS